MNKLLLIAAASVGLATMAHSGADPVIPGVPVVITTSITIPTTPTDVGVPVGGSVPVFFIVTPPVSPGGSFTFRLVSGNL
jgi:hypothetical protein